MRGTVFVTVVTRTGCQMETNCLRYILIS